VNPGSHPIELVSFFLRSCGGPFAFEFSKYVYRPRSTEDDREYFRAEAESVREAYEKACTGLRPGQDIAVHSTLSFANGRKMHIPMIDLSGRFEEKWVTPIGRLMRAFGIGEFAIYSTGRSAHVYGLGLIAPEQVVHFFGHSLLLNLPDQAPIVDTRWVGHRLIAGYGSLRWSCNGGQYLQLPELLGRFKCM
jgi:hypothetical protein